ncbi:MAG TPA: DUF86 domain-containing protein [Methanosarcinales archaeon]|nr:DUF86 domain-containing protein [Methanosarcinales archaeon]
MSKRGDIEFLKDINEAIKRIEAYTDRMDYDDFLNDIKTQDAVVRNIEIIGDLNPRYARVYKPQLRWGLNREAVKNISSDIKKKHKNIAWKKIAGMRDRIIHFYFGVNWDIVWDVVKNKLPELQKEIKMLIDKECGG